MHEEQAKIIEMFRGSKQIELSTSKIVKFLYKKEFESLNKEKYFDDKEKELLKKRQKAQLHRKTLYHINRLIKQEILKISKIIGKNEKCFELAIGDENELIFQKNNNKKIIISKPTIPAMPIEGFEQKNIIKKYEEATWISRINTIIILCKKIENLEKLKEVIIESFSYINDSIGINDFETIIEKSDINKINNFINYLEQECHDYGKNISLIIDFSNIKDEIKIKEFIKEYSFLKSKFINIIFDLEIIEIEKYSDLMENIITYFSKAKIQIHIKNQECHKAPYILGRAGPYTLEPEDWKMYKEEFLYSTPIIVCGQSTISIDVEGFFKFSKNTSLFRQMILNCVKTLLYANSIQRNRSNEYFKYLLNLNKPGTNLLSYSRNYIRFWNYGWKRKETTNDNTIELIKSSKKIIDEFCTSEETIYKSCGMPTRFKVVFSCIYRDAYKELFTQEKFKKLQIKGINELYNDEIKKIIFEKEKIFDIFQGGDRLRFYRAGEINPKEIVREMLIIMSTYKIPFFCYDFGQIKGMNVSLKTYLDEE
jgi:hypothetical protein